MTVVYNTGIAYLIRTSIYCRAQVITYITKEKSVKPTEIIIQTANMFTKLSVKTAYHINFKPIKSLMQSGLNSQEKAVCLSLGHILCLKDDSFVQLLKHEYLKYRQNIIFTNLITKMRLYHKLPCYLCCLLKSIKHVSEVQKMMTCLNLWHPPQKHRHQQHFIIICKLYEN